VGLTGPGLTGLGSTGLGLTGPGVTGVGLTGPGLTGPGLTGPGPTGLTGPGPPVPGATGLGLTGAGLTGPEVEGSVFPQSSGSPSELPQPATNKAEPHAKAANVTVERRKIPRIAVAEENPKAQSVMPFVLSLVTLPVKSWPALSESSGHAHFAAPQRGVPLVIEGLLNSLAAAI
jgi:hypothetical protein